MSGPVVDSAHERVCDILAQLFDLLPGEDPGEKEPEWVRSGLDTVGLLRRFFDEQQDRVARNPFELSVEETLARFEQADEEEGWNFGHDGYEHLLRTAPDWPAGRCVVRLPRIRFGIGDDGVRRTFDAHMARIERVFGTDGVWRWGELQGDPEHLRLLAGNHTHKPCLEWSIVHLGTHRTRASVAEVRAGNSLAEELLVLAWMFPELLRAMDLLNGPGLIAAGYECNAERIGGGPWSGAPCIAFSGGEQRVKISAKMVTCSNSSYTVPVVLRRFA